MKFSIVLVLFVSNLVFAEKAEFLSYDFIDEINSKQSSWTAARNFPEGTPIEHFSKLCGALRVDSDPNYKRNVFFYENINADEIPESFDARIEWPECESIGLIRVQGNCTSCWAVATMGSVTDKVCIKSSGEIIFDFSPEDLMSCCPFCGFGCYGGYINEALIYWVSDGVVSGDANGCRPYTAGDGVSPECVQECQASYNKTYKEDKRFGNSTYQVDSAVDQIQQEILTNGPVVALIEVYEDFFDYKSGVYRHTKGILVSHHAVKIIGWGVEDDTPYWIVVNSWGTDWGEEGTFRMVRGENHCYVEHWVFSGIPLL